MKSTKAVYKSPKKLINKLSFDRTLVPNRNHGETVIPIGSTDLFIQLPSLTSTYTFNIINADEMTGNITLGTSRGASLKGLMLRSNGGSLSIDPIQVGTDELTLESDVKDGCFIETLSNGNQWFIWSVATGGTINVRTGGVTTTHTPTPPVPVYADITNVVITSDVRFVGGALEARHDLVLSGEGEPGAFLTISETTGNSDAALVFPVTIQIAQDGTWELDRNTLATNLPNATYTFDFNPTLGNGVQNQSFIGDTGPINFTVPSTFTPDPAEVVDFASGASAVRPDSTQIAVVVDSSAWNPSLVHGDTFDIIYSITDPAVNGGVTVSQTVTGTIIDDTPPAAPSFIAASIANINELSANGTAEPNKTITLFQDNLPLSPTVTSDGTGQWSFGPVVLNFNSNFTLKAQASEDGVGNPNRSAFGEYSPAFNYVQPVTPAPTIGVNGEQTSVWTNTNNSFTISGTTEIGATIEVLDGANPATLVSGPTVDGAGYWTATIDVAPESVTSLSAKATLAGHHPSQAASFQLNVDREPPSITLTGGAQTVYLGNIGAVNDQGATATDFSSATVVSDWATAVDATEGAKTVTYTATDAAGNTATDSRTVTVTTEVVVPTNLVAVDNGDGTVTLTGDVTGIYADNLQVKINAIDSLGLEEVYQESGLDVLFTVANGSFIATMTLDADTYTFEAQTVNSIGETSSFDSCVDSNAVAVAGSSVPSTNFLEDSSSLVLDQSFVNNGWLEYTTSGTLKHTYASNTGNGGIASIPVSLFSNTNTPSNIIYSLWFNIDVGKGGQSRMLKGTSGGTPATVNPNGPGIVWEAVGGGVFRLIEATSGITNGVGANTHSDGTDARFYYDAGNSLAQGSWHHVIVQHSWDGANSRWISNVFINGARATTADGTSVSDVHIDSGNTSQSILDTNGNNYLVCTRATTIDSYNVVIDSSETITEGIASAIYSDSTRQTGIAEALAMDTTAPVITIRNNADNSDITGTTVNITEGDTFAFTVTATDNVDGDISANVTQGGDTLDTTTAGTYNLTFDVSDSASPTPNATQATLTVEVVAAGLFLEELPSAVTNLQNGATISNDVFIKGNTDGATKVDLNTDGIIQFAGTNPVNTDFTLSFWFRPDQNFGTGHNYIMGKYAAGSEPNTEFRIAMAQHSAGYIWFRPIIGGLWTSTPSAVGFNSFAIGNWYHVAMTYKYNSATSKYEFRTYIDGNPGGSNLNLTYPLLVAFKNNRSFAIGKAINGSNFIGTTLAHSLDSIQFGDGVVLDSYQIAQIYNQSDRLMTINQASALTDPNPSGGGAVTFIEDIDAVVSRNPNTINTSTGEFRDLSSQGGNSGGIQVLLETDNVIEYNAGQPVNDEFTISWWMKPDATQAAATIGVLGYDVNSSRRLTLRLSNVGVGIDNPDYRIDIGTPNSGAQQVTYQNGVYSAIGDGNWHHFAIRCQSNGSGGLITQLFVDGSVLSNQQGFANLNNRVPDGYKILPPSSNESFYFGTAAGVSNSIKGQFDSMQIGDGIALSDSQISAIANHTDRNMTIATANGL